MGSYLMQNAAIRIVQICPIFQKHSSLSKNTFNNPKISKDSSAEKKMASVFLWAGFEVLQQFFDQKMQNQRETKITPQDLLKTDKPHPQAEKHHPDSTQNSKLLTTSNINFDSFPSINSLFLRDNSLQYYNLPLFSRLHSRQNDNDAFFEDQSQVQMLTFGRGYSEEYHPEDKLLTIEGDRLYSGQLGIDVVSTTINESLKNSGAKGESALIQSGQELQSNSINSQSNNNLESPSEALCTGLMVKNVTKNIGKLLFKYIWKNRAALRQELKADEAVWQQLMCMIRACKKQNNVTRDFLLCRFHSTSEECRLLRVLAHNFFRKHCLGAIFGSKITSKRIHFQRIRKFKQALTNMRALDYLA